MLENLLKVLLKEFLFALRIRVFPIAVKESSTILTGLVVCKTEIVNEYHSVNRAYFLFRIP